MALIVATALFIGQMLDGLTFAAVQSLPGLAQAEANPITRALYDAGGLPLFLGIKLGLAGLVGVMLVVEPRVRGRFRPLVAAVTLIGYLGAASNLIALDQLASFGG